MKLYHGTNENNLSKIMLRGLQPRKRRKSQWEDFPSRADMVYLTTAYALYFAMNGKGKGRYTILEIESDELNQDKIYPDEDFISQALAQQQKIEMKTIHNEIRDNLELYQKYWINSIEGLGNCCYKGTIPFSAVKRICFLEPNTRMYIEVMAIDPAISIMNYTLLGEKYRSLMAWLFGDLQVLPSPFTTTLSETDVVEDNPMWAKWNEHMKLERQQREKESNDRTGIEIQLLRV